MMRRTDGHFNVSALVFLWAMTSVFNDFFMEVRGASDLQRERMRSAAKSRFLARFDEELGSITEHRYSPDFLLKLHDEMVQETYNVMSGPLNLGEPFPSYMTSRIREGRSRSPRFESLFNFSPGAEPILISLILASWSDATFEYETWTEDQSWIVQIAMPQ